MHALILPVCEHAGVPIFLSDEWVDALAEAAAGGSATVFFTRLLSVVAGRGERCHSGQDEDAQSAALPLTVSLLSTDAGHNCRVDTHFR